MEEGEICTVIAGNRFVKTENHQQKGIPMKPLSLFVIQPFSARHSDLFWKLANEVCQEFDGEFEIIRADKKPSEAGTRLQDRINDYIKNADICLADMTGSRNENVLLEVGAAMCLKKPVILVSEKDLPSDISNQAYIRLETKDLDKEAVVKQFKEELRRRLSETIYSNMKFKENQFIVYGYENRRVIDFYSLIKRCQSRINILTTNLGFIVNEKLRCGLEPEKKTILSMIAKQLPDIPSGFSMKILTLDPDSNYTNDRALALSKDKRQFREHMRADLNTVIKFIKSEDCCASVELKTYDVFPLQMTYFFDDIIVSSVVNHSKSSRECIAYLHSLEESGVSETYAQHFHNIWGASSTKPIVRSDKHAPRIDTW